MNIIQNEPNTGKRIVATIIDYIIIIAFFIWFVASFGEPNEEGGKYITGTPALIPLLFWFVWLVISEAAFDTTLGHNIMGLKIVSTDGEKISIAQAFKRRIFDLAEIVWCFGVIAFFVSIKTENHQRIGDMWAKTLVIDKRKIFTSSGFEFETPEIRY